MTRFASAFGDKYAAEALRTKSFELGGQKFKVRIPLTKEMNDIQDRITNVDPDDYKLRFDRMTSSFVDAQIEGVVKTDDDFIVDGRSTKELVENIIQFENRIVEYIKLLVPVNGTLDDITYAEIEDEWPMSVQMELLKSISEAIQPGYKESRGNQQGTFAYRPERTYTRMVGVLRLFLLMT